MMIYSPVIDVTASFAPVYFGMLAVFLLSAVGILFSAWTPRWNWKSFFGEIEIAQRGILHWSK